MASPPETFRSAVCDAIRAHAMTHPEAEEGSSCVNRAFKAGGKNFAFLGEKEDQVRLRLKLDASIADLEKRAKNDPERWQIGKGGWTLLIFPADDAPKEAELQRWVTESFRLLAPKKIVALLDK